MPTYEYRKLDGETGCEACTRGFERLEGLRDDPLTACPTCGGRIHRVITAPRVGRSEKDTLSDKNLRDHGFQRFVKEEPGRYRKTT